MNFSAVNIDDVITNELSLFLVIKGEGVTLYLPFGNKGEFALGVNEKLAVYKFAQIDGGKIIVAGIEKIGTDYCKVAVFVSEGIFGVEDRVIIVFQRFFINGKFRLALSEVNRFFADDKIGIFDAVPAFFGSRIEQQDGDELIDVVSNMAVKVHPENGTPVFARSVVDLPYFLTEIIKIGEDFQALGLVGGVSELVIQSAEELLFGNGAGISGGADKFNGGKCFLCDFLSFGIFLLKLFEQSSFFSGTEKSDDNAGAKNGKNATDNDKFFHDIISPCDVI